MVARKLRYPLQIRTRHSKSQRAKRLDIDVTNLTIIYCPSLTMFRSAFQLLNTFLGSHRRVVPVSILGMRIHG
jgi:hypothetical protein